MCFSDTTERKRVQFTPNSKRVSSTGRAESSVHNCIASRFSSSSRTQDVLLHFNLQNNPRPLYKGSRLASTTIRLPIIIFLLHNKKEHRMTLHPPNIDAATVDGFGKEGSTFTQHEWAEQERAEAFAKSGASAISSEGESAACPSPCATRFLRRSHC